MLLKKQNKITEKETKKNESKEKKKKNTRVPRNMFKRTATAENYRFSRFKKTSLMKSVFLNYIA